MRIVHVTPGYWPELGGVERHVQDVSEALARLGHYTVVVAGEARRACRAITGWRR
ncbi:MAG: hypothetical protein U0Z44_15470 [Kouleothrix sp.]